jgi:cytochrome c
MRIVLAGVIASSLSSMALPAQAAESAFRGHGGPVRALAISRDGSTAVSGSFDQSAIVWNIDNGTASRVLRFHEGAVNAVVALSNGRFVTGGEDGRIAVWQTGESAPLRSFEQHNGPVVGLAVSPDGKEIASASWDETVGVRSLTNGASRTLKGHHGNVNAVAFLPDGSLVSAGYDATLRVWSKDRDGDAAATIVTLASPLNALVIAPDGEIATAGSDGVIRLVRSDGTLGASIETQEAPTTALALSPDGSKIAAGSIRGTVTIMDRKDAKLLRQIAGNGQPVWAVAFRPGRDELLTGGSDRLVRRWNAATGESIGDTADASATDMLSEFAGDRGAELFRACVACHTLKRDAENRAGPSLHQVFGRRIATATGYNFSPALKKLDIIWNAETISKLFEVGPSRYTPGTKMPDQVIGDSAERAALIEFLEKATMN